MLDYKDLAALPKTKAIYNIDRPDMLSYSPYVSYASEERHYGEVDLKGGKGLGSVVGYLGSSKKWILRSTRLCSSRAMGRNHCVSIGPLAPVPTAPWGATDATHLLVPLKTTADQVLLLTIFCYHITLSMIHRFCSVPAFGVVP